MQKKTPSRCTEKINRKGKHSEQTINNYIKGNYSRSTAVFTMIEENELLCAEQKFLSLINSRKQMSQVLGTSSTQNLVVPNDNSKDIKRFAYRCIEVIMNYTSDLTSSSATGTQDTKFNRAITLSHQAFLSLYYSTTDTDELISIVKRHQSFTIKLFLFKNYEASLKHLLMMQQVLTSMVLDQRFKLIENNQPESLLQAIPYVSSVNSDQIVNLVTAFDFLSCQYLIKSVSLLLSSSSFDEPTFPSRIILLVPEYFLSTSNFIKWLPLNSPQTRSKHISNIMKILNGLIKICHMVSKSDFLDLKLTITKLTLKLIEFQWLQNQEFNVDLSCIKFDSFEEISFFYNDLQHSLPLNDIPELESLFHPTTTLVISESDIICTLNDIEFNTEKINTLRGYLLSPQLPSQIVNNLEFLTTLYETLQNQTIRRSGCINPLLNLVLKCFIYKQKSLKVLSNGHFLVFDFIAVYFKELVTNSESYEFITDSIPKLVTILVQFNQFKRLKNLANILYSLGFNLSHSKPFPSAKCLLLAIKYNCLVYKADENQTLEEGRMLVSKVEKCLKTFSTLEDHDQMLSDVITDLLDSIHGNVSKMGDLGALGMKQIIKNLSHCIYVKKDLSKRLLGTFSKYLDTFKASLFIQLLKGVKECDKFISKTRLIELLINNLEITDYKLKLICIYNYYSFTGLDTYANYEIDYEADNDLFCHLMISGIALFKNINMEWSRSNLSEAIQSFEKYLTLCNNVIDEYEFPIFCSLIEYLNYNQMFKDVKRVVSSYQLFRSFDSDNPVLIKLKFDGLLEYASACLRLKCNDEATRALETSGKILKSLFSAESSGKMHIGSKDLMNWKLVQLDYYISKNDFVEANEKLSALLKFSKSKPEFSIFRNDQKQIPLVEKLQNLMAISNLNLSACELCMKQSKYINAYLNAKTGLKLALSIVKNISEHIPEPFYNSLKWKSGTLLFKFYQNMIDILCFLGISRDLMYYINELKKLNDSNIFPIVNGFIHYYLSNQFLMLDQHEIGYFELAKGKEISKMNLDKNLDFQRMNSEIFFSSIVSNNLEQLSELRIQQQQIISELETSSTSETTQCILPYGDISLQMHYNSKLKSLPNINEPSNPFFALVAIKAATAECMEKLSNLPSYSDLLNSVVVVPIVEGNQKNSNIAVNSITQELQRLKGMTQELLVSNICNLPVHVLRDISNQFLLLGLLLSALGQDYAPLRCDIYYAQDLVKSLSMRNEMTIRNKMNVSSNNSILPTESSIDTVTEIDTNYFMDEIRAYLPQSWTIMTIDFCPETEDLVISKLNHLLNYEPVYIRLPLNRMLGENVKCKSLLSFKTALDRLSAAIKQSNESIKPEATRNIKTKEDRKDWWRLRFALDLKIKELLNEIEFHWLGAFSAIFAADSPSDSYKTITQSYVDKFQEFLIQNLSTGKLSFRSSIIEMLLNLDLRENLDTVEESNKQNHIIDDLIYFLIDSLMYKGQENAYDEVDLDKFYFEITELCIEFRNARSQIQDRNDGNHLIIIPGPECAAIPWESLNCLKEKAVSRMPSIRLALDSLKKRRSLRINETANLDAMYLINPGGDLLKTEERFKPLFITMPSWLGLIGSKPSDNDKFLLDMLHKDMFIYIGHGGCEQYIRVASLFKFTSGDKDLPPALLLGCSSGALQTNGIFEANGNIYNWLACGSPMVVANLWDVTDKDIDKFSLSVFELTSLFGKSQANSKLDFSEGVKQSRLSCNLRFLNGSAPVVYGLPLHI